MVNIKIKSIGGRLPEKQTEGAAGYDLYAFLDQPVNIGSGKRAAIPTGICLEIPSGYEAQIRARSGLAFKKGLTLINGIGTIDSDYRGEIICAMVNLGHETVTIENEERIAQLVVARYEDITWESADELEETERAAGGFGHTGAR